MHPAKGWFLFACALALSPACRDDAEPADIGQDASLDARRDAPEANRDIGHDAPRDTARDVPEHAPEDSAIDGGPDDPGWVRLAGLPDYCAIERATHPERLWRSEWLSCGDGCVYLSDDPAFTRTIVGDAGWHDGEMGVFVSNQVPVPASAGGRVVLIARTDGHVYAAWREPLSRIHEGIGCQIRPVGG